MARYSKGYVASTGLRYQFLVKDKDGRWRNVKTGEKWTDKDERRAIARYMEWERTQANATVTVSAPLTADIPLGPVAVQATADGEPISPVHAQTELWARSVAAEYYGHDPKFRELLAQAKLPANLFYAWLREELIEHSAELAKAVGIPELASLSRMSLPQAPVTLTKLAEVYREQNGSTVATKCRAMTAWSRLIAHTKVATLDELTTAKLQAFRQSVESSPTLASAASRQFIYGKIKSVISFGLKAGLDVTQIQPALGRCKVLFTNGVKPVASPKPIKRNHFHTLLTSGNDSWRPWLLVGLNCAMYMEELCQLRWEDLDLEHGYYIARRGKTGVVRCACLWKETVEALKTVRRRGQSPFVFTSQFGTRYNKNTRLNDFAEMRERAGLPEDVKFSHIRDGAYTAAAMGSSDERQARILAGHAAAGMLDRYVQRNAEYVRPACDAVYKTYLA